jgi:predicted transcriptional regulator
MKRTTVYLPTEADLVLKKLSLQTGRSQAELIREAIEQYIMREKQSLPRSLGMGASGRNDLSERDEELLWEEG